MPDDPTPDAACSTCNGSGVIAHTSRGSDGFDPCPDCDPTVPTPRPLTADEVAEIGDNVIMRSDGDARAINLLVATVERLQAEVDRLTAALAERPVVYAPNCDDCPGGTDWQQRAERAETALAERTAERDAADAVIRRYGSGWWPDRISTIWFDVIGEDDEGNERPSEPITPAEVEALRRARAAQPGEGP